MTQGRDSMVFVAGGRFRMGSADFYPEERPVREVEVDGFWMDEHPVTVAQFRPFVKATRYPRQLRTRRPQFTRAFVVPMHGTQRVRPSGASVGRRQASTSSAPPQDARIHERAGRGMP